ncbi:glycosyltransferase family 4 protein [Baileyella intestinalis]|uniref:glycosyltransferase family 4 protein n=1 Tax=Baileyella intestinalis TaxID=2606709 RepID=UPI0022E82C88|nr:glycosyltransferase family 4 protein [Baileyella intestinalis]
MAETKGIAIFSAQFYPHMGGVERYTYKLSVEMVRKGYDVVIVTSGDRGKTYTENFEKGISVVRVSSYQMMNERMPVMKCSRELSQIITNEFQKHGIEFCIVNTRFYLLSVFGMRYARKNNIPLITIEHGSNYLTFNNVILDVAERVYEKTITAVGKRYCDDYYAVSEFSLKWLREFGIEGKGVLYNSIDPDDYPERPVPPSIAEKIKPFEGAVKIAFAGRLIEEKGVNSLLQAYKIVREKYNVCLIIMGTGPLERKITESDYPDIIFLGQQNSIDVVNVLRISDIFCLPSRSEGFSTSVLEAALAKCCIVTTKNGGSAELISSDELGLIIDGDSPEYVENALEMTVNNSEYIKSTGENVYRRVINQFAWKKCADKLEEVIISANI